MAKHSSKKNGGFAYGLPRTDSVNKAEMIATNLPLRAGMANMFDGDVPQGEPAVEARRQYNSDDGIISDFMLKIEYPRILALIDTVNHTGFVNPCGSYDDETEYHLGDIVLDPAIAAWSAVTTYALNSIVKGASGQYISIKDNPANLNKAVTDVTYWTRTAGPAWIAKGTSTGAALVEGDDWGAATFQVDVHGAWDTLHAYVIGDCCTFGGWLWQVVANNNAVQPVEGANWTKKNLSGAGNGTYPTLKTFIWQDACIDCGNMDWEGTGWYLPNASIAYHTLFAYDWNQNPPFNSALFPSAIPVNQYIWTSELTPGSIAPTTRAQALYTAYGGISQASLTALGYVWPVRANTHARDAEVLYNPYADVDWETWLRQKAAFHIHTDLSTGVSVRPDKQIDAYIAMGYKIIAITDHRIPNNATKGAWPWTTIGSRLYEPDEEGYNRDPVTLGVVAVPGSEAHSSSLHHIVLFCPYSDDGAAVTPTNLFDAITAAGGLGAMAHPGGMIVPSWGHSIGDAWPFQNTGSSVLAFKMLWDNRASARGFEINSDETTEWLVQDLVFYDKLWRRFLPWTCIAPYSVPGPWLYGSDDSHQEGPLFSANSGNRAAYTMMLMTEDHWNADVAAGEGVGAYVNTKAAFAAGQMYVVICTNAVDAAPVLTSFTHDAANRRLVVDADNYTSITWHGEDGPLGQGTAFYYDACPALKSFVRCVIANGTGAIYMQPVVFNQLH